MSDQVRVIVNWTARAEKALKKLPNNIQRDILDAIDQLYAYEDPRNQSKRLGGTLSGFNSIRHRQYRIIFNTEQEKLVNGDTLITYTVYICLVGKRESKSRKDVYNIAKQLADLGILDITQERDSED